MGFARFHLHPLVMDGIRAAGYEVPTPIQEKAVPPAKEGRDLIGLAQTGTGKTAAFALPILDRLLAGRRGKVRALVLAPTRELAEQIAASFKTLGAKTGLTCGTIYGGVGMEPQIDRLRKGLDVVVACPGRLLDHMNRRTIDLSGIEVLVVDEADRMFDMGFLPDVRRIIGKLPRERQSLLFSATMPDDVRALTRDFLRDPVTVQIGLMKPANSVAHAIYPLPAHLKSTMLLRLLDSTDTDSVIVFTKTKHRAKKVQRQLEQAGHRATALQGNLSQNRRTEAIDGFRKGTYQIMVATDIASRGIDVSTISHVINYDIPDTVDAYTHRIGRTGRMEKTGDALTLVTAEDEPMIRAIEKALGEKLERRTVEGFDYRAPEPPKQPQAPRPPRRPQAAAPARQEPRTAHPAAAPAHHRPGAPRRPHQGKDAGRPGGQRPGGGRRP